ncbi:MAG: PHP domain-containing protein [Clostridia bacterium]|nr:PHP domain-containing protein [Clostridia bacterium]
MSEFYYDLHLHSCLSPCADNDMTPNNIAGMGKLSGLQIMAVTDHNSAKNCPAFFEAAARQGIVPVAGMELTTAEDIHVVCLFETVEAAMAFDADLQPRRMLIENRVNIFGDQIIVDGDDNEIGRDPHFLSNATSVTYDESLSLVTKYQGVCYPAHIDRQANGVIAVLGAFPETPPFRCAEVRDPAKFDELREKYPILRDKLLLSSSDAHYLWDIRDKCCAIELGEAESEEEIRTALFECLRKGRTL